MQGAATSPDGIRIAYDVAGTGSPAIVFVHGWSCDRSYWANQIEPFAARHRVVAVDLAGHGSSGGGRSDWTMPAFGADVASVVEALGLDEVVLAGHSMGGDVIVETALALPGQVRGLVWVDTYRDLSRARSEAELDAFIAPFLADFGRAVADLVRELFLPTSDPRLVERVAADMAAAPPAIALNAMRHSVGNLGAAVAGLDRLGLPAFAINPDRPGDPVSLRRHGMTPVILAGLGHFPMLEDPDRFNEALAAVVARLVSR